ncbi:MAG: TonB-dependent receptor [Rhodospirillaceae bacterium]|nr:TonB-dependent receptor [Rhodospirillaceae bacterium]
MGAIGFFRAPTTFVLMAALVATCGSSARAANSDPDEIVVTARKRTETLATVPASVTVLTADDLEALQIKASPEIAAQVPGLMWESILGYATPNIFLRGIGNATFNANQAGPVGIHRDGIYQGSSVTYGFGLYDLDRVEVLKGPQGTLFGRNTTGGVINFVTRKPDVADGLNANGSATYGRFNEMDFAGAVGAPVGDAASVRLAAQSLSRDGYVTNQNPASGIGREGKIDMHSARGQFRVQSGALDVLFGVRGAQNRSDVTPGKQLGVVCPATVRVPALGACADFLGFRESTDLRTNSTNIRSMDKVDSWGTDGTLTWAGDGFAVTSQTAFDANHRKLVNDSDSGPYTEATTNAVTRYRQFSEEVRALSNGAGPLTWIAGANYYRDDLVAFTAFNLTALGPGALSQFFPVPEGAAQVLHQRTESYAGFGEAGYALAPGLTVTAGVRWTHDKRSADINAFLFNAAGLATTFVDRTLAMARLLMPTIPAMTTERAWSRWGGRGVVSYELQPQIMIYAGVARGFKGGDFNGGALFAPTEANITGPEYVTSFEAGVKGATPDWRFGFDAAAFYYDFSDQQVSILVPGSHATLQQLANAGKTGVKGVEGEVTLRPVEALRLEAKAAFVDARFVRFQRDASNPTTNFAGNRPAFSPTFSFAAAARYTADVAQGFALWTQLDTFYKGARFFSVDNNPALMQRGVWLADGSVALGRKDGRYTLTAWVKNIGDVGYFGTGLANSGLGFLELIPGPPRTFGLTLSAKY